MPALIAPTQETIDTWEIAERGVKDGSSPRVTFDRSGSIGTRQIMCLWDYRYDVARWFVGEVNWWLDGGVRTLTRLVPQKLPKPSGEPLWVPDFYATKIEQIEGHCWDGNEGNDWHRITADGSPTDEPMPTYQFTEDTMNRYTHAIITIQYERLPFAVETDAGTSDESERWVQYITKPSPPDYITVPASTQNYLDPAGVAVNDPPGHRVPVPYPVGLTESSYRFALKWCRIPYDLWGPQAPLWEKVMGDGTVGTSTSTYLNAVNRSTFLGKLAPGTVMLEEVTEELIPVMLEEGLMSWDITYHFWYKPGGHNKQWYFPNSNDWTAASNLMKRMFVGRGSTYYAPGSVPDLVANYCERDLYELFNIDS